MNPVLFVVFVALGLGFCLGKWWEHDRPGGTLDLDEHIDALEVELEVEQLDNAILRGERDERRAASMYAGIRTTNRLNPYPAPGSANGWPTL